MLTKELLNQLYWEEGKSLKSISLEFDCSPSFIVRQMIKLNIKRRNRIVWMPAKRMFTKIVCSSY